MGIAYLILFIGYILISIFLLWLVRRVFWQHRLRQRLFWLTVAVIIIFPTYDIIIQLSLLKYYDLTRQPLQHITCTVDVPGSVYWEDNIWPGYDKNYRLWMSDHLLDGEHLDTLAMNGEDGKIYLYRYGQGDITEVFTNVYDLPPLNYHIEVNPVPLWFWQKPFIWGDRIEITDNRTRELIAYSERYMGYSPQAYVVKMIGGEPFEGGQHLGEKHIYGFDDEVIFSYGDASRWQEMARSSFSRFGVFNKVSNYVEKRKKLLGGNRD